MTQFKEDTLVFEVIEKEGQRIERVRITRLLETEQ